MSRSDKIGVLFFAACAITCAYIVVTGCMNPSAAGPRTITLPDSPVLPADGSPMGPPAPVEIDQDSLAGQIVAKLEARLQVMLSSVANVASGNTTYFSWGVAGVFALGWLVQARSTKLQWLLAKDLAAQLDRRATESNEREMKPRRLSTALRLRTCWQPF